MLPLHFSILRIRPTLFLTLINDAKGEGLLPLILGAHQLLERGKIISKEPAG
jgi:hypothetical protein